MKVLEVKRLKSLGIILKVYKTEVRKIICGIEKVSQTFSSTPSYNRKTALFPCTKAIQKGYVPKIILRKHFSFFLLEHLINSLPQDTSDAGSLLDLKQVQTFTWIMRVAALGRKIIKYIDPHASEYKP